MTSSSGNELIPRATVEELVTRRNRALSLFGEAHAALSRAVEAIEEAGKASRAASPGVNRYNRHLDKAEFHTALELPARDTYVQTARRIVDTDVWSHIVQLTELERLMDKKAKDQFNQQLIDDPPEVTVENVCATLQQFAADVGTIFKRGMAECFSNLDRRFRSHDGWKIGSRVVLTRVFDDHGFWNLYSNHRDTILDVERVFRVLDGGRAINLTAVHAIEQARGRIWGARQTEIDTDYFLIRAYKNGNAHLWFKRDDLVERVNRLLGEYYGAPIPDQKAPDDDGGLYDPKLTPAKNYGFFPTPEAAADRLIEDAKIDTRDRGPLLRVLEPSAGFGSLARRCLGPRVQVDCVEIQPALAAKLTAAQVYGRVHNVDFLQIDPATTGLYDRIVMNPPFDRERDIDHVIHALKFLKPDGFLCAIMSAGTEFRETRKSVAFRALMEKMQASWRDLPPGSFSASGTNCNTIILRVWKDGRRIYG